jgi:hypothetical protein
LFIFSHHPIKLQLPFKPFKPLNPKLDCVRFLFYAIAPAGQKQLCGMRFVHQKSTSLGINPQAKSSRRLLQTKNPSKSLILLVMSG